MNENVNLGVEYVPLDAVTPYERNARKHGEDDVDAIANSIKEFGFDDPIGVWGEHNLIVEGHGRLLAAKKLGMDKVPIIHLDHLTDEQRRAYALAHNRTAELSRWDYDMQASEVWDIQNIDMSLFGIDVDPIASAEEISRMLDDAEAKSTEKKQTEYVCPHCGEHFKL